MQIRKVKSTNGLILIRAEEASGEEDIRRIEIESRAEPRPEFHEAMGGLILPALEMIEAPFAWKAAATISGLSLTHEEERGMGSVVTLLVPLKCAPSPLVLNTPHLTSEDPSGRGAGLLSAELCQAVEHVIDEALRYLNGERAQADLFHAERVAEHPDNVPVDNFDQNGVVEEPAAEPQPPVDGPILDRPPQEVRAEFERIRTEVMRKQPVVKPARGRRAVKADS